MFYKCVTKCNNFERSVVLKNVVDRKQSTNGITNERYRFVVFVALVHSDIGDKNCLYRVLFVRIRDSSLGPAMFLWTLVQNLQRTSVNNENVINLVTINERS